MIRVAIEGDSLRYEVLRLLWASDFPPPPRPARPIITVRWSTKPRPPIRDMFKDIK